MMILKADADNADEADNPRFELRQDGELVTGVLTVSTSDMRMKINVANIEDGLERVMALRGVRFNWKEELEGR